LAGIVARRTCYTVRLSLFGYGSIERNDANGHTTEELVAELAQRSCAPIFDLSLEPREDHADYITNRLLVSRNDNGTVFTAARHALRATDFLNGLQETGVGAGEPKTGEAA